ncbi:tyrosine phosphatase family protein [Kribbella voronezhensis]|uniref:Tyrosine phosphatase family protein n=1 Tax=Kribbella voronezhensis TaxID=2512212 RepID=A0A4R7TCW7_9ACTN|nr:tyrosine-protein phosphatase [Kribbella voronezhensis]TDU89208.1 tyrosine phosphatase family protein [Kribbella voronezhensis]
MTLDWPLCKNARDLGGTPTADGARIRTGALVRSDNLDQLDEGGIAAVHAAGVSRIVDLRSAWECEKYPSPFADDPFWLNVPLIDPEGPDVSTSELSEQYRLLLDGSPERFAAAIAAVAEAPPGCVVVACHAGKDRTGLVIALVLHLVGVPVRAIAADYVASPALSADSYALPELAAPRGETISRSLDHLQSRYGGTAAYLRGGGATDEQFMSLAARLG